VASSRRRHTPHPSRDSEFGEALSGLIVYECLGSCAAGAAAALQEPAKLIARRQCPGLELRPPPGASVKRCSERFDPGEARSRLRKRSAPVPHRACAAASQAVSACRPRRRSPRRASADPNHPAALLEHRQRRVQHLGAKPASGIERQRHRIEREGAGFAHPRTRVFELGFEVPAAAIRRGGGQLPDRRMAPSASRTQTNIRFIRQRLEARRRLRIRGARACSRGFLSAPASRSSHRDGPEPTTP